MSKIKIVNIEPIPWWKFWTTDNLQVTAEDGQGKQKTFTIYHRFDVPIVLLKKQIAAKYYTGDQFWNLHQREKREEKTTKIKTKTKENNYTQIMFDQFSRLKGESFDRTGVLSEEAEG